MAVRSATKKVRYAIRAQIGQVMINWANLEWQLSEAIYLISLIDPKVGRLVAELPKARERVKIVERLLRYREVSVSVDLTTFGDEIKEVEEERNMLAHGVWVVLPGQRDPWLRVTSGKLDSAKFKMKGERIRKMYPEILPRSSKDIRNTAVKIGKLCSKALALRREVKSLMSTQS